MKVQINFDGNLDADWIKVFKDSAIKIEEAAPGIEFITDESVRTMDIVRNKTIYKCFIIINNLI